MIAESNSKTNILSVFANTLNIYIPNIYYAISKFIKNNAEISCSDRVQLCN